MIGLQTARFFVVSAT